ncbi:protoporphyrinogen/coproporphyrinogen oxidase [Aquisphaera insulae]|uniref:protoporphyrinogen/coproporphyrinogen oxidase n=1 Tax=Aquisphaera insulae TaxID=2712864 RepID=UPI0013EACB60|nr:NAD(P)-binding protein [Aquisphaera insulae]
MHDLPVVVLGAGPAGIATGLELGELGVVFEGSTVPGGLCRTIEVDGATFDLGGHSFHTPHPEVRELVFGAVDMFEQRRDARCFVRGTLIPYPFQQHYRHLPDKDLIAECDAGLEAAGGSVENGDYEGYLRAKFGAGIARHFLLPYNRKLWKTDLAEMSPEWAGERVAGTTRRDGDGHFARSGGKRTPLRDDTSVAYPARGGFGEILGALAGRLQRLEPGRAAAWIDPAARRVTLRDGESRGWTRLVSTLSLPRLLAITEGVPPDLLEAAGRLRSLPVALVMVVVGHAVDTPIQRIYSAEADCPAHKIVVNHNSSDFLRAQPRHGIMAEVSLSPGQTEPAPDLAAMVLKCLREMGLVGGPEEVVSTRVLVAPDGYPIPTHDRNEIVRDVRAWLEKRGIFTVGRFAEWAYINADEAMARGLALGRSLRAELRAEGRSARRPLRASRGEPRASVTRPHLDSARIVASDGSRGR